MTILLSAGTEDWILQIILCLLSLACNWYFSRWGAYHYILFRSTWVHITRGLMVKCSVCGICLVSKASFQTELSHGLIVGGKQMLCIFSMCCALRLCSMWNYLGVNAASHSCANGIPAFMQLLFREWGELEMLCSNARCRFMLLTVWICTWGPVCQAKI